MQETQDEKVQINEQVTESEIAEEITAPQTENLAEEVAADTIAVDAPATKQKKPLPPKIQKIVDYLNAHEDIRQMVFFLMFSVICGLTQMIVTYGLSELLVLVDSLNVKFKWFIFDSETTAHFIGFLVGSIIGQILTFILNRKKTFNTPDHVAIRATMYTILAILIILMQTALGNAVISACYKAVPRENASAFLNLVFNLTGQAVAGIAAVIVNFLGNKFLVMRDWGKKKSKAAQADEIAADDAVEISATTENEDAE